MTESTLSGVKHSILADDPASEWLGIEVQAVGTGQATISMTLRREMLNGFGMAHGGMIFAFADTAFALACNPAEPSPQEAGLITVAAGADINFLKPAFQGQRLTAVAGLRSTAGRSALYDIQVFAADPQAAGSPATPPDGSDFGELIAEFRGRSRTIAKK